MTFVVIWHAAVRTGVGLVFIAAALSKLLRPRSVRITVERYALLPSALVSIVALLLAPIELVTGLLLVLLARSSIYGVALALATGLLLLFSVAIASALARGLVISCGCGTLFGDHVVTPAALVRNVLLLIFLAIDSAPPL